MGRIGVIGGSGLYELEGINKIDNLVVETPFGEPSDKYILCELEGKEIVFLPRHGKHHNISPTKINYRANIFGFKKLGVDKIISISACGSLKEALKPLDFVIPDQFVDRTNQSRESTFFDEGIVAHIGFANPVCEDLTKTLKIAADKSDATIHYGGTYLNMEGPQFSTLAESNLYRSWGMDIIGMTNIAEARLAREAEICYTTLAAITDYDCWYTEHKNVTVEMVLSNLRKNVKTSKKILREFLLKVDIDKKCSCNESLKYAIVTNSKFIPKKAKDKLALIIGRYIK